MSWLSSSVLVLLCVLLNSVVGDISVLFLLMMCSSVL